MEELLTTEQIAQLLKLNIVTIRRYIKSGKLKAAYFGKEYRVTESDFKSFIDQHRGKRKAVKVEVYFLPTYKPNKDSQK